MFRKPLDKKRIVFIGPILIVLIVLFFHAVEPNTPKDLNFSEERDYWEALIDKNGAEKTYDQYVSKFSRKFNEQQQHAIAHIMGELLYEKKGKNGIKVCDATFQFGCFHGFLGVAIPTEGIESIGSFNQVCVESFEERVTACQHGIGHGIMEYVRDLEKALEVCDMYAKSPNPLAGCTSGVFMEYNIPLQFVDENNYTTIPREAGVNIYQPCDTFLSDRFSMGCYFNLPQWWSALGKTFSEMGSSCEMVENSAYQISCFEGMGNIAPSTAKYSIAKTIALCDEVSLQEGKVACKQMASWAYGINEKKEADAYLICENLSTQEQNDCAKYE